jgi:hypothetical protein
MPSRPSNPRRRADRVSASSHSATSAPPTTRVSDEATPTTGLLGYVELEVDHVPVGHFVLLAFESKFPDVACLGPRSEL